MLPKNTEIDVISDVLKAAMQAFPDSDFIMSLRTQYIERGSLSKKQLEGLYQKAAKANTITSGKLATLEAIIKKMRTRYKSELPVINPPAAKDDRPGKLITEILEKYPQHKRVIYFKVKYENNEILSSIDLGELEKFHKLLL